MIHGKYISLVVAMEENGGIGLENALPWPKIQEDMRRFRTLTLGNSVIMGRHTAESLPQGFLPGRQNIVLTRDATRLKQVVVPDIDYVGDMHEAVDTATRSIAVIGGQQVYELFLPWADSLYITLVHGQMRVDTFFPPIETVFGFRQNKREGWKVVDARHIQPSPDNPLACTFLKLERRATFYPNLERPRPTAKIQTVAELQQELPLPPARYPNPSEGLVALD